MDADTRQDIAQDITLALWKRLQQPGIKNLDALIHTYTRNRLQDWRRSHVRRDLDQVGEEKTAEEYEPEVTSTQDNIGTHYVRILEAAKGVLTKEQIDLMLQGYTVEEIAEKQGIKVSTLRNRIATLRKRNKMAAAA
jgi:RNA polymerase sigma factor (sigma-70 family)